MKDNIDLAAGLIPQKVSPKYAYKMGYDCAKNGANEINCNFLIWSNK